MPTLAFEVRANHDTGVSRYGLSVLRAATPLLVADGWNLLAVAREKQKARAEAAVSGHGVRVLCAPDDDGFVRRSTWLRSVLTDVNANLFYTAHYTVDRQCPVPFVLTIHDLTRLRFPELSYTDASFAQRFGPAELDVVRDELAALARWDSPTGRAGTFNRYFWALNRYLAERARHVVTVSNATAGDIRKLLRVSGDRLTLAPCGVDLDTFYRRGCDDTAALRERLGLPGPYVVFVGLAHPNKRFPWLVQQLVRHRHRFPPDTRLVAVGGHAEQVPQVTATLAQHDAEDFVIFTGRVCDDQLATLYSAAAALVTASLNEGNNLPPLEALACGCEVITTDIPPLRETLADAATYYDPHDGAQLASLVERAVTGELPRRVGHFVAPTWRAAGQALADALTQAYGHGRDQARRIRA